MILGQIFFCFHGPEQNTYLRFSIYDILKIGGIWRYWRYLIHFLSVLNLECNGTSWSRCMKRRLRYGSTYCQRRSRNFRGPVDDVSNRRRPTDSECCSRNHFHCSAHLTSRTRHGPLFFFDKHLAGKRRSGGLFRYHYKGRSGLLACSNLPSRNCIPPVLLSTKSGWQTAMKDLAEGDFGSILLCSDMGVLEYHTRIRTSHRLDS